MKSRIAIHSGGFLVAFLMFAVGTSGGQDPITEALAVPSLVSTTSASKGWAVNYPKQRKVFEMAGLLWVFYSDGVDGVFRSSRDGKEWSDPDTFAPGGHFGHRFGGWFDGTYFHYCLCTAALGADVYYRRGKPSSNGKMKWSAPPQVAFDTPSEKNVMYPKVIVDSMGHPWITFMQLVYQIPNLPPFDGIVVKASTNDGKWKTAAGFPFKLVSEKGTDGYPDPVGAPLTRGKTVWIYNHRVNGEDVYAARIWNGRGWEDEEIVVSPASNYSFFNVVGDADDVHLIHGAGTIQYQKRTWEAGWSKTFTIDDSASGHTCISRTGKNSLIVTWLDTANQLVRYREMAGGKWGSSVSWVDESIPGFAGAGININSLVHSARRFRHAVFYSTGHSAPYDIKSATLLKQGK